MVYPVGLKDLVIISQVPVISVCYGSMCGRNRYTRRQRPHLGMAKNCTKDVLKMSANPKNSYSKVVLSCLYSPLEFSLC